jgi:hypothetical protein
MSQMRSPVWEQSIELAQSSPIFGAHAERESAARPKRRDDKNGERTGIGEWVST